MADSLSTNLEEIRRSVKYHPSIWKDHFLAYTSDVTEITDAEKEQLENQKEKVRNLLAQTPDDSTLKIKLIDAIQRLGIGYHFEEEIDASLRRIHDTYEIDEGDDVRLLALRFRLLRQHGYRVPSDVFNKLVDEEGKFKQGLLNNIEGMLSLYEASNYGISGDEILEKALQFSSSHLESLTNNMNPSSSLSRRVTNALSFPINKTLIRCGARKFLSTYQEDESHNELLSNLARLDFNLVQKMHQRELHHLTRWWKDLDLVNKLPYARDRVVECYFWTLGVYYEPKYELARLCLTKVIAMVSILDDTYDVYGSLDELRRFTGAIQRWDLRAVDEIPPYMGVFYEALIGVYAEMEEEMAKQGQSYRVQYSKKSEKVNHWQMIRLAEAYMEEVEWCYSKHIPTVDEYMKLGELSSSYVALIMASLVGMGDDAITKHDFDWITNLPPIVRASAAAGRLTDDVVGHGKEKKIAAIDCYMKENGCTEKEAFGEVWKRIKELWEEINGEMLEPREEVSSPILHRILNLTRVLFIFYDGDDGYTNSTTKTKHYIQAILVDPMCN